MTDPSRARAAGASFNAIAEEYDRNRPAYPDALVDHACARAGLGAGDPVLEIGCGTGQLTRALLARGLRVTAVEPGDRLAAVARQRLAGAGELEIVEARLEDARLPAGAFRAVFSASAIHWIDPDVGWPTIADALAPEGTLALLHRFGLRDPAHPDDQDALLAIMRHHAPELAARHPRYHDLQSIRDAGVELAGNISELWSWLGGYDLARPSAAERFQDAELTVAPTVIEQTADELNALTATMSVWSQLSSTQRDGIVHDHRELQRRLGRPIRASLIVALGTARRRATDDAVRPPSRSTDRRSAAPRSGPAASRARRA